MGGTCRLYRTQQTQQLYTLAFQWSMSIILSIYDDCYTMLLLLWTDQICNNSKRRVYSFNGVRGKHYTVLQNSSNTDKFNNSSIDLQVSPPALQMYIEHALLPFMPLSVLAPQTKLDALVFERTLHVGLYRAFRAMKIYVIWWFQHAQSKFSGFL